MDKKREETEVIPNQTLEAQPKKAHKWRLWCCGLPVFIVVLVIIVATISVFRNEKKLTDKISERGKAETYSEIFNSNYPPEYAVTASDEEKFNQKIVELLQKYENGTPNFSQEGASLLSPLSTEKAIEFAKSDMKILKDNYPEGYYLVVNSVLKTAEKDQLFPNMYLGSQDETDRIDLLVHELSHIGSFAHLDNQGRGYIIEDKYITRNMFLEMPKASELLKYINDKVLLDDKYLEEANQDIFTTLDEVISYTKSLRFARAYARYKKGSIDEGSMQATSRQLYYLSLQLKNIKENHPDDWQKLKNGKGFVYITARQVSVAKTEIQAAKDDGASSSSGDNFAGTTDKNLSLFEENKTLFDEIYASVDLDSKGELKNLSQKEVAGLGIKVEKF